MRASILDSLALIVVVLALLLNHIEAQDEIVRCMWESCIDENEVCEIGASCVFITEGYSQCRETEDGYIPPLFVEGCIKLTDGAAAPPYSNGGQSPCSSTTPCCNSDATCINGKCLLSCSLAKEPTPLPTESGSAPPTTYVQPEPTTQPTVKPTAAPTKGLDPGESAQPTFSPYRKPTGLPTIAPIPIVNSTSIEGVNTNIKMSTSAYVSTLTGVWAVGISSLFYIGFLFFRHQKKKKDRKRMEKLYRKNSSACDEDARYIQQMADNPHLMSTSKEIS